MISSSGAIPCSGFRSCAFALRAHGVAFYRAATGSRTLLSLPWGKGSSIHILLSFPVQTFLASRQDFLMALVTFIFLLQFSGTGPYINMIFAGLCICTCPHEGLWTFPFLPTNHLIFTKALHLKLGHPIGALGRIIDLLLGLLCGIIMGPSSLHSREVPFHISSHF